MALRDPKSELLSNTWKSTVQGATCWQSKRLYPKRAPGRSAGGWGSPGELLCHMAHSLGVYGMWLASGWSLASHSDSGSFLVAHASLSQDRRPREGSCEVVRHVASPFDLSGTLPVGGGSCPKATGCRWLLGCLARAGGPASVLPLTVEEGASGRPSQWFSAAAWGRALAGPAAPIPLSYSDSESTVPAPSSVPSSLSTCGQKLARHACKWPTCLLLRLTSLAPWQITLHQSESLSDDDKDKALNSH